ncbi:efflux RND transporter periplasmic adaptor subunit [Echinicola rosea]|uniref:Hemolysin D n=1 Tax=Echinicola rosea TaxID=1807691 RepID=A0ABQ1UZN6_9BACT|nr:efflux RND transporter periplasmic adaptor subunit [Echinicola rosea]GGF30401.1 hemolysin D [Echinicola rosea]
MKILHTPHYFTITLLVFACILYSSCSTESKPREKKIREKSLPVMQVTSIDTALYREYVADIKAIQNVELRSRVPGFLEEILIDEGKYVKKGQLLFKTNDEEYKAALAKASANLTSAIAEAKALEYEVDRLRIMVNKNVISESELNVALAKHNAVLAKIEEAKSAYAHADTQLGYTEIKAPFSGIIDRIPHRIGSLLDQGSLLTKVSDISAVHVYFNVSEREYLEYVNTQEDSNNDIVKLILADGTPYPYEGKIETMEGEFNANTGSIAFRARFPNQKQILKHGATGKVVLTNQVHDVLMVPQKAVFEIQDRHYVFVLDENNQVKMKSFVPKVRFSHYYVVESGIEEGDNIVYEGIQDLQEGMTIQPKFIAADHLRTLQETPTVQ